MQSQSLTSLATTLSTTGATSGYLLDISILLALFFLLVFIIASSWFAIRAFRVSFLWGLATSILPPAALLFAVLHWKTARAPLLLSLASLIGFVAFFVAAGSLLGIDSSILSAAVSDLSL